MSCILDVRVTPHAFVRRVRPRRPSCVCGLVAPHACVLRVRPASACQMPEHIACAGRWPSECHP